MDAIALLEQQHHDVEHLFEQLSTDLLSDVKRTLAARLGDALSVHAALEELHFYPAVRAPRTEELLQESLQEHLGMKRALAEVLLTDPTDRTFAAKIKVLRDVTLHHIEEERTELFPQARELLGPDQLEAIGQLMTSTMTELERGTPRAQVLAQVWSASPLAETPAQQRTLARFPKLAKVLPLPMQLLGRARSLGTYVWRTLLPRPRRRARV